MSLTALTRKRKSKLDLILEAEKGRGAEALRTALTNPAMWSSTDISELLSNAGYEVAASSVRDWRRKNKVNK